MKRITLLFTLSLFINGVFGDEVSVMEGDSVTLHTNTVIQALKDVTIIWKFGAQKTRIAQINKANNANTVSIYDNVLDGKFRGRLQLNDQTGDLIITDIRTTDSGLYIVDIHVGSEETQKKSFDVKGVVGAGGVKSVSVMEGDSVTLHTDDPIQKYDVIRWRFQHKNSPIAEINRTAGIVSTYDNVLDGRFKDKLQLDVKTGFLDIKNIRTNHSGLYQVDITSTSSNYTIHQSFNVTLSDKVKPVSVIVGDPVTLQTYLTELQKDELIKWWFRHDDSLIAQIYKLNKLSRTYDGEEGKFRGRLKLNNQTGDLTITDSKTEHTGLYEVKMSDRRRSIQRRFSVHVSEPGFSLGAIVLIFLGICVFFILLAVIYYCCKTKENPGETKTLEVIQGESVDLKADVNPGEPTGSNLFNRIKGLLCCFRFFRVKDKQTWRFGETLIAEINPALNIFSTYNDDLFKDNLNLNHQTGDLTIKDFTQKHTGVYTLKIIRDGETSYKRFIVFVRCTTEELLVYEEEFVDLMTEVTDIKKDDVIEWRFEETLIAEINPANNISSTYDGDDDLFRDKLNLNHQTGDLNINDIRRGYNGVYTLKIIRDGKTSYKRFSVFVRDGRQELKVYEGHFFNLKSEVKGIKIDDKIEWRFGDKESLIAEINPANNIFSTYDGDDNLFRGKLKLNHQTGDLTVNDIRLKHTGVYKLKIIRDGQTLYRRFRVFVRSTIKELQVDEGESVPLKTEVTDIRTDDVIKWRFKETLIAKIYPANNIFRTYDDDDDDLFRGKLKLNHQTGDLNINDIRWKHDGFYTLKIIRDGEISERRFIVFVRCNKEELQVYEGKSVDLKTEVTDVQRDDVIEWRFGKKETLIAEINLAKNIFSIYDGDDGLFRDKLNLNRKTGDLNINNIIKKHEGFYTLKIIKGGKTSYKRINVFVTASRVGDSVEKRGRDSVRIEMQPLLNSSQ